MAGSPCVFPVIDVTGVPIDLAMIRGADGVGIMIHVMAEAGVVGSRSLEG